MACSGALPPFWVLRTGSLILGEDGAPDLDGQEAVRRVHFAEALA